MKQDEARPAILAEFRLWAQKRSLQNATGQDGMLFFAFLENDQPGLLDFRAPGDKWQVVHSWLISAGLVSN